MMFSEPFHGYVLKTINYSTGEETERRFFDLNEYIAAMQALNPKWHDPGKVSLFTQHQVEFYEAAQALLLGDALGQVQDWTKPQEGQLALF